MKKIVFACTLFSALALSAVAQLSLGGIPPSFEKGFKSTVVVPVLEVAAPDMVDVQMEDEQADSEFRAYRVATLQKVGKSFTDVAVSQKVNGGVIWRLNLSSCGALGLAVYSDEFYIPDGGRLFAYDVSREQLMGAFSALNNNKEGVFAMDFILGSAMVLEYFQPDGITEPLVFEISEIAYGYRSMGYKNSEYHSSGTCNVNMACSEGDDYRNQGQGVVRISVRNDRGVAFCSGTLINNTRNNKDPLILTAGHCVDDGGDTPRHTARYVYRFQFETPDCSGPEYFYPAYRTLTGSDLLAYDTTYGSLGDFALFRLKDSVPDQYEPYWCGWDRGNDMPSAGVGIHHPSGDVKKISTYDKMPTVGSYPDGNGVKSHFKVNWVRTDNGFGITEGGSSGSALFNSQGLIVGDLTGGRSDCAAPDRWKYDYYGRIYYNWDARGSDRSKLRPWLDPDNTGAVTHLGMNKDGQNGQESLMQVKDDEKISMLAQMAPIPFEQTLTLVFGESAQNVTLQITDMTGVALYEEHIGTVAPMQRKVLPLSELLSGVYVLTIISNQEVETHKIIKE